MALGIYLYIGDRDTELRKVNLLTCHGIIYPQEEQPRKSSDSLDAVTKKLKPWPSGYTLLCLSVGMPNTDPFTLLHLQSDANAKKWSAFLLRHANQMAKAQEGFVNGILETGGVMDKCVQMWTRNYGALGQTARVCFGVGQVCPDVDKELWRLGPDGSGVFWRVMRQ
ncbi:hypothetical protein TNCV_3328661 [Trichonephila clavipes]|nr:hypothetical protein TNCV_3328661 [Trichonephila clavipes]